VVGFIPVEKTVEAAEAVVVFQRDHGNRQDRKQARLKYTIDNCGLDYFRSELQRTHGLVLEPARPFEFTTQGDDYGWHQDTRGDWHFTLFVEGGKLTDKNGVAAKTAIREIAEFHTGSFILTGNQNLTIAQITPTDKPKIESVFEKYSISDGSSHSQLRLHSIACAALPYCGLSFAEAERYLPVLVDKIEELLGKHGLHNEPISIRMTGCPNGCGRPFLGEIALVGRAPGKYNLYLGASFSGNRLNKLYKEMLGEDEILATIDPLLADFAANRSSGEHFGDFVVRKGYVKAVEAGKLFHEN